MCVPTPLIAAPLPRVHARRFVESGDASEPASSAPWLTERGAARDADHAWIFAGAREREDDAAAADGGSGAADGGGGEEAARWYDRAAELGSAHAKTRLGGELFVTGYEGSALSCWEDAATHGHAAAQLELAEMHARGFAGLARDDDAARLWATLASHGGNEDGQRALRQLGVGEEAWFRRS